MPTDRDTALRILVRKKQIKKEEWLKLIEARRLFIKDYFNKFTLPELGSLECLESDTYYHELNIDGPEVISGDKKLSLKMQGIFYRQPWGKTKYDHNPSHGFPDGTLQIWGLTRLGSWITVEVNFAGEAGYKHRGYQKAKTVKIERTNLVTIISRTGEKPIEIWRKLGEAVEEWTERCKKLHERALEIREIIKTEDKALSLITHFPIFD